MLRHSAAFLCALHIAGALHMSNSAKNDKKVTVRVYGEAGCRFTRLYLTGPVRNALSDPATAEAMDFDFSAFGNAYFMTKQCEEAVAPADQSSPGCGGGGGYSASVRSCFNRMCGLKAATRPEVCFNGPLICQHGLKECSFDRYFACAKRVAEAGAVSGSYMPFVLCMVDKFEETEGGDAYMSLLAGCANSSGVNYEALRSCYGSNEGSKALADEAASTPDHLGVPWITVDGYEMEESYEPNMLQVAVQSVRGGAALPTGAVPAAEQPAAQLQLKRAELAFERESVRCDETKEKAWRALSYAGAGGV